MPGFVRSPGALMLGLTAQTFGQSPAKDYLGIGDPVVAYALDEAIALRLLFDRQPKRALRGSIPAGQVYEQAGMVH